MEDYHINRNHGMFAKLLLLFVLVPLAELALLIRMGDLIGLWPTVALVFATGAAGAALARSQGLQVLRAIRTEMSVGQMPAARLWDGLLILVGGVLLLTPGLLTDTAGLLLLLPATRARFTKLLRHKAERMVSSGQVRFTTIIR